jgi:hypothetical protein
MPLKTLLSAGSVLVYLRRSSDTSVAFTNSNGLQVQPVSMVSQAHMYGIRSTASVPRQELPMRTSLVFTGGLGGSKRVSYRPLDSPI